jgi:hypothetical protein
MSSPWGEEAGEGGRKYKSKSDGPGFDEIGWRPRFRSSQLFRQSAVLQATFIRVFFVAPVDDGCFANRSAHRPVNTLIRTASGLLRTFAAIIAPFSVKA